MSLAIRAAASATPVNPSTAAITATTRKTRAQRNLIPPDTVPGARAGSSRKTALCVLQRVATVHPDERVWLLGRLPARQRLPHPADCGALGALLGSPEGNCPRKER